MVARPCSRTNSTIFRSISGSAAICAGEEFYEVDRQTIEGRELILMESCRDGAEAPGIIVDAISNEIVLDEANDGFQDYIDEMVVQ
jgi:hypothetical protein